MNPVQKYTADPAPGHLRIDADAISSPAAYAQCCLGRGAISNGAARTIAGWWAMPQGVGRQLAALHSGEVVETTALLQDIREMRQLAQENGLLPSHDAKALDRLAEWARNYNAEVGA